MSSRLELRSGRDPGAAPVLFLHGFASAPEAWEPLAGALRHGGALAASELPGHGLPPRPLPEGGFDAAVRALSRDVAPGAFVVGYSLGARLALGLAAAHPERVRGVVAIGAHLGLESTALRVERQAWERELASVIEHAGLPAFVERWQALPLFETQRARRSEPEIAARLAAQREQRLRHDPASLSRALVALGTGGMPLLVPRLRRTRTPILLLAGEHDARFVQQLQRGAELGPHVATQIVSGAGHHVALEAPERLASILDERFGRWSSTRPLEESP